MEAGAQWNATWGFLAKAPVQDIVDKFRNEYSGSTSTTSLLLRNSRRRQNASQDSVDSFVHQYMLKTSEASLTNSPKSEFQKPLLTSHSIGWGKSLERFGPLTLRDTAALCLFISHGNTSCFVDTSAQERS
ncbi:hypothetical protein CEUSTIGMA_g1629.t1 [Chlamydomonas eustigma]|uniref:Uncharacterized protein n=1 Tax=Chlamydomonas eustigma TaxID=1157962 RepID=A0A250WUE7_9CHLO|nr:hypothetical protein CEUSTIGMA_g1629.t1 [Chlamydomonas eustigma]|eukprot:GAX74180.1 hypothetical protein CEUSTIGMA_g1629.t1 [Chlamydomonas eustigma]